MYLLDAQISLNNSSKNLSYKGCDYNEKKNIHMININQPVRQREQEVITLIISAINYRSAILITVYLSGYDCYIYIN